MLKRNTSCNAVTRTNLNKRMMKSTHTTDLFSEEDPNDLLSSLAPLAVEIVSTFPSKSNVVSMFSLDGSVGLSARGDRLYVCTKQLKNMKRQKKKEKALRMH